MNPVPLPTVRHTYLMPEECGVNLSLDRSPFGLSEATPTIYVSSQERPPVKFGLNRNVDVLVARLVAAQQIVSAIITGAERGNFIILNLGGEPTSAPETALYERMVTLTNWLNANAAADERQQTVGRQMADLVDPVDETKPKPYNKALPVVHGDVRAALVAAFNRALDAVKTDPEAVPVLDKRDFGPLDPEDEGDASEEG